MLFAVCGPYVRKMRLYTNKSLEMLSQRNSAKTAAKIFPTTLSVLLLLSRANKQNNHVCRNDRKCEHKFCKVTDFETEVVNARYAKTHFLSFGINAFFWSGPKNSFSCP